MKSQAYAKSSDPTQDFYANQKKIYEINPRHPIIKELLKRIEQDDEDVTALSTAQLLYETAVLRSGYSLKNQVEFAERIEGVSYLNLVLLFVNKPMIWFLIFRFYVNLWILVLMSKLRKSKRLRKIIMKKIAK